MIFKSNFLLAKKMFNVKCDINALGFPINKQWDVVLRFILLADKLKAAGDLNEISSKIGKLVLPEYLHQDFAEWLAMAQNGVKCLIVNQNPIKCRFSHI